jgi:hypothetical protein
MEIKFEQQVLLYVAEFKVASNCNLHIERESRGAFTIAQRGTKQGKYAYITDENYDTRTIIDVDMLGNIYPKYIKITSVSKPTYAEVNFAGEGGNSDDGGSIGYYKIDENFLSLFEEEESLASAFDMFPILLKSIIPTEGTLIASLGVFRDPDSTNNTITTLEALSAAQGIAIFTDVKLSIFDELITTKKYIEELGIDTSKWQKITEEEFYNLEV